MDDFLAATTTKLKTKNYNELNIVIGNESCDLDSAVSAVVYSIFLNWQHNQIKCKVCTRSKREEGSAEVKDDIYVPVLNVNREDYGLKTEVAYFFKQNGILEQNLLFRDDYDFKQLVVTSNAKVTLVDHHVLAKSDEFLAPYVVEIIDHRPLSKSDWLYKEDTRSTIETVGSCCTLLAQGIKDLTALLARGEDFLKVYAACTQMLHATIVLDTVNFSKEVNKATPHDEEIIQFLESLLQPADFEAERQRLLDALVAARSDVSSLTPAQLLRKDVKIVADVLVPSFPVLVKEFLSRPGALVAVSEALARRGCEVALLLGMDLSGGLRRDAAVYSNTPERAAQLAKYLEDWTTPGLGLVPEKLEGVRHYYKQTNLSASRKQYMPALSALLSI